MTSIEAFIRVMAYLVAAVTLAQAGVMTQILRVPLMVIAGLFALQGFGAFALAVGLYGLRDCTLSIVTYYLIIVIVVWMRATINIGRKNFKRRKDDVQSD